jgi:hypothetical protein
MSAIIYKYLPNWYIARGHDHNGRNIVGFGSTHSEALQDFFNRIIK